MKKIAIVTYFLTVILLLFGLVTVMSASSAVSYEKHKALFGLFQSHTLKVIVGIIIMTGVMIIDYHKYIKWIKPLLVVSVILLVITLFMPSRNNASRWIYIMGMGFQPVDFVRLVLVIYLAAYLQEKSDEITNLDKFLKPFVWVMIMVGLVLLQPNVSSGIMLLGISLAMLYVGGASFKHVGGLSGISMFIVGIIAFILPHSHKRIMTFINGMNDGGDTMHYQVKQSIWALGSGGITGIGIGNSRQSNLFLPESYSDFIYAVIGEEFGLLGTVGLIAVFFVLFFLGYKIARNAPDKYGSLLAFGITLSIALYSFVNMGVVSGLLPATGLPLPFISYGGTSIFLLTGSIGILINIAYQSNKLKMAVSNPKSKV